MGGPIFLGGHLEKARSSARRSRGLQLEAPRSGGNDWGTARDCCICASGKQPVPGFQSETPPRPHIPTERRPKLAHLPPAKLRDLAAELLCRCQHCSEEGN